MFMLVITSATAAFFLVHGTVFAGLTKPITTQGQFFVTQYQI
jgi:hypothetical protein